MIEQGEAIERAATIILRDYAAVTHVSQTEIAKRTGITQSQISKLFRLIAPLSVARLATICAALDLSPAAVLASATEATLNSGEPPTE